MTERGKRSNPARVALMIGAIFFWSAVILFRLVQLQIFRHEDFLQQALQRQQMTSAVIAPRGAIYDCHFDELATNVTVSTVVAEPRKIKDVKSAAANLASILGLSFDELYARMTDPARQAFMIVKRRIAPNDESCIEALETEGIYLVEESMRVYPNRELACQTLGFVNMNGDGGAGIEMLYDQELKGTQGQISFDVDARRRPFRGRVEKPPIQGRSLILSIDRSIQYIAERELAAGVENTRATAGVAIVMESDTGRILALANYPNFNCNAYNEVPQDLHRNRAITDYFEPGSTFKVVVATAALEAGLTNPDELIDCQMGAMTIGRHVFHDHRAYSLLTFREVLEFSSNIGAAKLGLRLGEEQLYEALRKFGFGSKTGIDLPGEIIGLVRDWRDWSGLSVAAISFGQEVGVTSVQILCAINAIANGGYLMRPSVVDRVIDQNGDLARVRPTERVRIMRPETAAAVREAFEGVVLRGTARKAALDGYRAAGKTGTAQKIVDGIYSNSRYVASFIGFAPLPQPRITVLVQIDEPRGSIYGGDVSAPVFRRIAQETLLQLHAPPDQPVLSPMVKAESAPAEASADFRPNATPVIPLAAPPPANESVNSDGTVHVLAAAGSVEIPDFSGMSKRGVVELCHELGIRVQMRGTGTAIWQQPAPGMRIAIGDPCSVTFARAKPVTNPAVIALPGGSAASAGLRAAAGKR